VVSRDERRALLFLAVIAVAGGLMRVLRGNDAPAGAPLLAPGLSSGDVARQARLAQAALEATRPLLPGELVDVDTAPEPQIERLPRVGPQLARRIVEEREAHGPFGSLEGLKRVSGIGPATLKGFEHTASFSGTPWVRDSAGAVGAPSGPTTGRCAFKCRSRAGLAPAQAGRRSNGRASGAIQSAATLSKDTVRARRRAGGTAARLRVRQTPPDSMPESALSGRRPSCTPPSRQPGATVSLNHATEDELACLPGVGPVRARAIVTWRTAHMWFTKVEELEEVPGIRGRRFARLAPLVQVP